MELFKLFGTIAVNNADANKAIDDTTSKAKASQEKISTAFTNAGDKMSQVGKKLMPVSVAIGGIGLFSIKAAADVKAANSQFEQTFGNLQDTATGAINKVAETSGILDTRLKDTATSIYAFARSSGAETNEAMSLMETSLQAAADSAAYYDTSLEQAGDTLMSFLKGNFANDAALGVSCTEFTRNAKATELFGQKYNDLTEIQKQQTLLKMVTDSQKLSGAMGQAARESDGFENVMGNTKESAKQLAATFGEVVLPKIISLMQKATELLQGFRNMDEGTKKLIITIAGVVVAIAPVLMVLGKMFTGIGSIITVAGKIPGAIQGAATSVLHIKEAFTLAKAGMTGFASQTSMIGTALAGISAPVVAVVAVIGTLIAAFMYLWNTNEEFRSKITAIWDGIKEKFNEFTNGIVERLNALGFNFKDITEVIKAVWDAFCSFLAPVFEAAFSIISTVFGAALDVITGILDIFIGLFTGNWEQLWNGIKEVFGAIWDAITGVLSAAISLIVGIFDAFLGIIGTSWETVWGGIKTFFTNTLDSIKTTASNIFNGIKDVILGAWEAIKNVVQVGIMFIVEILSTAFDLITLPFRLIWENCKETILAAWEAIKTTVSGALDVINNVITNIWNGIVAFLTPILEGIKNTFLTVWNAIKDVVTTVFDAIKSVISTVFNFIKDYITNTLNNIRTVITNILNAVKTVFTSVWDGVKSKVTSVVNSVKSVISSGLNGAKSVVTNVLNSIKNTFQNIFEAAKNIVKGGIDKIKSFFNFSWSLPKIKLPHFNISGKFSLNPPSIPKFGIEWYKKAMDDGMILDQPTIFGVNKNGQPMGAGEAGSETVVGTGSLFEMIKEASNGEENENLLGSIINMLSELITLIKENSGDIIIPVYVGTEAVDEMVVSSKERISRRSGGRADA